MEQAGDIMNDVDAAAAINQAVNAVHNISQRPVAQVLPHSDQIQQLFSIATRLHRSIANDNQSIADNTDVSSSVRATDRQSSRPIRSRRMDAGSVLRIAIATAPRLADLITQRIQTESKEWFDAGGSSDPRTSHIQPILSLQGVRSNASAQSGVQDRLLLTCSCQSLAMDFEDYERSQHWEPRHRRMLRHLSRGQEAAIQQQGGRHHHQNFLSSLEGARIHRAKFDAALRLGAKIRLIQACGEAAGLGSILALLLGYECQKLTRLPFREFHTLHNLLQTHHHTGNEILRPLLDFAARFGEWWSGLFHRYHNVHCRRPIIAVSTLVDEVPSPDSDVANDPTESDVVDESLLSWGLPPSYTDCPSDLRKTKAHGECAVNMQALLSDQEFDDYLDATNMQVLSTWTDVNYM